MLHDPTILFHEETCRAVLIDIYIYMYTYIIVCVSKELEKTMTVSNIFMGVQPYGYMQLNELCSLTLYVPQTLFERGKKKEKEKEIRILPTVVKFLLSSKKAQN